MPRTIGIQVNDDGIPDIDGSVPDALESLRQRIQQAIQFQLQTWFMNTNAGIDYDLLRGHQTTSGIATQTITQAIIDEGGDEVLNVSVTRSHLDRASRVFTYQSVVDTIYSDTIELDVAV